MVTSSILERIAIFWVKAIDPALRALGERDCRQAARMLKLSWRIDEKFHFIVRILHFTVNLGTYMPYLNFNIFCVVLVE